MLDPESHQDSNRSVRWDGADWVEVPLQAATLPPGDPGQPSLLPHRSLDQPTAPPAPPSRNSRKNALIAAGAVGVVLVIGAAVVMAMASSSSNPASRTSPTATPMPPATVSVETLAADDSADSFTRPTTLEEPTVTPAVATKKTVRGDTELLYAAQPERPTCDRAYLIKQLSKNPERQAQWASALGKTPEEVTPFVGTLTPLLLRQDTWVTNTFLVDDIPTPRPVVLAYGTAVLVDPTGAPTVRCITGSPLTPATGTQPESATMIKPAKEQITEFTVGTPDGANTLTIEAGTDTAQATAAATEEETDEQTDQQGAVPFGPQGT